MKEIKLSTGRVVRIEALALDQVQMALEISRQSEGMRPFELIQERVRMIAVSMSNAGMPTDEALQILEDLPITDIPKLLGEVVNYTFLIRAISTGLQN